MLSQHLKAGNIQRIAREVFASVPPFAKNKSWVADKFLAASRLRSDGVIGYHCALELHGYNYSEWGIAQVIAPGQAKLYATPAITCRFVVPRAPFHPSSKADVTSVDRLGLEVKVTTLERTIVDLFDRCDLAGGVDELFNSLGLIIRIDEGRLVEQVRSLDNASASGAIGFWLAREQAHLNVSHETLDALRALAPKTLRYALGTKPGEGRAVKEWGVILPERVVEPDFEGVQA